MAESQLADIAPRAGSGPDTLCLAHTVCELLNISCLYLKIAKFFINIQSSDLHWKIGRSDSIWPHFLLVPSHWCWLAAARSGRPQALCFPLSPHFLLHSFLHLDLLVPCRHLQLSSKNNSWYLTKHLLCARYFKCFPCLTLTQSPGICLFLYPLSFLASDSLSAWICVCYMVPNHCSLPFSYGLLT